MGSSVSKRGRSEAGLKVDVVGLVPIKKVRTRWGLGAQFCHKRGVANLPIWWHRPPDHQSRVATGWSDEEIDASEYEVTLSTMSLARVISLKAVLQTLEEEKK
jgi:hypothetical protein